MVYTSVRQFIGSRGVVSRERVHGAQAMTERGNREDEKQRYKEVS